MEIIRSKEKHVPVMSEFYEMLKQQKEKAAGDIALALEVFVEGSLNIFNHQNNVLLNLDFCAQYLQQLWKKVCKQGGLCTGITQKQSLKNKSKNAVDK